MEKRLIVMTHMFVRWLTDFGNVVTFMDKEGYAFTIHTNPPADLPYLNWDAPALYKDFESVLPAGTDIEFLPYRRGSIDPIGLVKMVLSAIRLGRRYPDGLYMFWSAVILITMGLLPADQWLRTIPPQRGAESQARWIASSPS